MRIFLAYTSIDNLDYRTNTIIIADNEMIAKKEKKYNFIT